MSPRTLLITAALSFSLIARAISEPPSSPPSNPEINRLQKEIDQRLHTLTSLNDELYDLRLKAGDVDLNEMTAFTRQVPNVEVLRKEISSREGDITNLLKDGFEENHPRVLALRAEVTRQKQRIIELQAEEALRKSLPEVIKQQMALIDALNIHLQQAIANAAPPKQASTHVPPSH